MKEKDKNLEKRIVKHLIKYYIPKHGLSLAELIAKNSLKGLGAGSLMWTYAMFSNPELIPIGLTSIIGLSIGGAIIGYYAQEYYIEKEAEEKGYEKMLKEVAQRYSAKFAHTNQKQFYEIANETRNLLKAYQQSKNKPIKSSPEYEEI